MAQTASNYEIVQASNAAELEILINAKFADGYFPVGGVFVYIPTGLRQLTPPQCNTTGWCWYQAIYKPK